MPVLDAVYIGLDPEYPLAYEVCRRSILKYAPDLKVYPVNKVQLRKPRLYQRRKEDEQLPDCRYSRFLVPYLHRYKGGYVLYCDSSFFWFDSPRKLEKYIDPDDPVSIVLDEQEKKNKNTDPRQYDYSSKPGCCSLMIFNCNHYSCVGLRPNDINKRSKEWFHNFQWVERLCHIGSLPAEYQIKIDNNMKEVDPYKRPDKNHIAIQYTMGGPWMKCCHDRLYTHWWMKYLSWEEKQSIVRGQKSKK